MQRVEFEPAVRILDAARSLPGAASARLFCALFLDFRRLLLLPYNLGATTTAEVLNEPALADQRLVWDRLLAAQGTLITDGIAAGELLDLDADFANRAVAWLIEGAYIDASRREDLDPTEFADQVASFSLRALLVDGARCDRVRTEALGLVEELEAADPPEPAPGCRLAPHPARRPSVGAGGARTSHDLSEHSRIRGLPDH